MVDPIPAIRANHVVLFVSDLERSVRFWTAAFAMDVVAREPGANAAFLRLRRSGNHHDLGLFGIGPSALPKVSGSVGMYHVAWQVDVIEDLEEARPVLVELDAYTGESSHGATKSVYGRDPDGNEFEVMWMMPREEWGAYACEAPVGPLDLSREVAVWSGVATAETVGGGVFGAAS